MTRLASVTLLLLMPAAVFAETITPSIGYTGAPADHNGQIIGSPVVAPGVIEYPLKRLGLCAGITSARFKTTTEVYPDSPRASPEQCNAAQVAAVCAAIDFALGHRAMETGGRQ